MIQVKVFIGKFNFCCIPVFHLNKKEAAPQAENTNNSWLAGRPHSPLILLLSICTRVTLLFLTIATYNHFLFNIIENFSLCNFGTFQKPEFDFIFSFHNQLSLPPDSNSAITRSREDEIIRENSKARDKIPMAKAVVVNVVAVREAEMQGLGVGLIASKRNIIRYFDNWCTP